MNIKLKNKIKKFFGNAFLLKKCKMNQDISVFSYKNHKNGNMKSFNFYRNNKKIGFIDYYIEHTQITIIWLTINEELSGLGYGSRMVKMFIDYIIKMKMKNKKINDMNMNNISKIILIPIKFDGINKNWLCKFYEKNGFIQEEYGYPFYIYKFLDFTVL